VLRSSLIKVSSLEQLAPLEWLKPFLEVILSEQTGGLITSAALSAVSKFLSLGFVCSDSKGATAMAAVCKAVTGCRFESMDDSTDEVVVLKLLSIIHTCFRCSAGATLEEEDVLALVKAALDIAKDELTSLTLRAVAETTLVDLTRILFECHGEAQLERNRYRPEVLGAVLQYFCGIVQTTAEAAEDAALQKEVEEQTDVIRLIGLNLLSAAVETLAIDIGQLPLIHQFTRRQLCQTVLWASRTQNLFILSFVMRLVTWLYTTLRADLKMQIELLIREVPLRIIHDRSSSPEARELAFDTIAELATHPSFLPELFVNYDCDLHGSSLCDTVLKLLRRGVTPPSGAVEAPHVAALRALVSTARGMAERARQPPEQESHHLTPAMLLTQQQTKAQMQAAAKAFNEKPKKGLDAISSEEPLEPATVARYLHNNPFLDKAAIGQYLGLCTDFSKKVLHEFVGANSMTGVKFDAALRTMLLSFRLPGEAQQIDIIMETFAAHFYAGNPSAFASSDAAYTLAFSTMMLNTDLHNPSVRRKMTPEDWLRNNRGIDKEGDIPEDLLLELYASIRDNEIKMLSEVAPENTDVLQWNALEAEACRSHGYLKVSHNACDSMLFETIHEPLLAALAAALASSDVDVWGLGVYGFELCAELSAAMHMLPVLNSTINTLSACTSVSKALEEPLVLFAQNNQSHIALRTLFILARDYGHDLRGSWSGVVDCIMVLHALDLLPESFVQIQDALDVKGLGRVPSPKPRATNLQRISSAESIRRLLWSGAESEESDLQKSKQARSKLKAVVQDCSIGELFTESKLFDAESVCALVNALATAGSRVDNLPSECTCLAIQLTVQVLMQNRDRFPVLWTPAKCFVTSCVQSSDHVLQEHGISSALRLCSRLLHKNELVEELLALLNLIHELSNSALPRLANHVGQGLLQVVQNNPTFFKNRPDGALLPLQLIHRLAAHPEAESAFFECLYMLTTRVDVFTEVNVGPCCRTLQIFVEKSVKAMHSTRALDALIFIHSRLCTLQASEDVTKWHSLSAGVVQIISSACTDSRADVAHHALCCLQRALLLGVGPLQLSDHMWGVCIEEFLFPVIESLPVISAQQGSSTLLGDGILVFVGLLVLCVDKLQSLTQFEDLWCKYLTLIASCTRCEDSADLSRQVPELLWPLLRKMCLSGCFGGKNAISDKSELWRHTLEQGFAFSPNLSPQNLHRMATTEPPASDVETLQQKNIHLS